jgi:outer membrane protein OmpA-like peptidoglycan-associated protein
VQAQSTAALAEKDRQLALEAERARTLAAQAEADRLKQQAEIAAAREEGAAKQRQLEEEAARARQSAQAAEEQARVAREAAQRAEEERTKMRAELVRQFNIVLATRESARGLIVNMSDVLFDTGRHTLKPGAREKLAKIAGIILAHPGLKIEVEGHADSTGGPAINQPLSEKRAESVRTYLVQQGVDSAAITSICFGDTKPVADNNTAAGRQANRRVELVVNGPMLTKPEASGAYNGGRQ